ncbi:unnamed protein product, partial [Musa hybrid cultivar]
NNIHKNNTKIQLPTACLSTPVRVQALDKREGCGKTRDPKGEVDTSSPLTADPASELDVLGHDGYSLRMDRAEIGVLEEANQIGLGRLLEGRHSGALEPEVRLEVLRDLPHQPLKGQLPDQQLRALLVLTDLPERHRPGPEAVRLLHATGRGGRLPGCLRRQLFPRCLPPGGLPRRLLRPRHFKPIVDRQ